MTQKLKIAEMLCTRLCHDLTGPIGAVNNGAEFLSEEGFNLQGQAVELITSSAFSAVARLQFYRVAYGRVKENGEASLADHQKLASEFFTGSRITLDWPDEFTDASGVSVSLRMMRLLFNLLIIAGAALIKGGTITVRISQNGTAKTFEITGKSDMVKWEPELDTVLTGDVASVPLSPKNVQLYVTRALSDELHAECLFQHTDRDLHMSIVQRMREGAEAA